MKSLLFIYTIGIVCGVYLSQNYYTPDIYYWSNLLMGYLKKFEENYRISKDS